MTSFIAPKSKLFAHLGTLAAIQRGERPAPINVEIFPSLRCGHGCNWCHYAYTHTRGPLAGKVDKPAGAIPGGDLLDWDLAKSILRQLAEYGVKSVTWSGGGEPTQNKDFDNMVCYAASVGLEQGLYTHGSNIDTVRAALLKPVLKWVYVSLDECTPEKFKANKGVNRFEKVLGGIRCLVAAEGDATIGVGFLLHEKNVNDVHDMVRLGRSLGVDYMQFRPVIHYDQDDPGKMIEADTSWIQRAIGMMNAYKGDTFVIADIDRFRQYAGWIEHPYSTCHWSALQTAITPNGKVWRCTNKTEHPDALLGDLSVESFAEIWQRSGGSCAVDSGCRLMCKGFTGGNQMLEGIFASQPHANFP